MLLNILYAIAKLFLLSGFGLTAMGLGFTANEPDTENKSYLVSAWLTLFLILLVINSVLMVL